MVAWSYGDDKLWWSYGDDKLWLHGHTEMISCVAWSYGDDKLWWDGHTEMISCGGDDKLCGMVIRR